MGDVNTIVGKSCSLNMQLLYKQHDSGFSCGTQAKRNPSMGFQEFLKKALFKLGKEPWQDLDPSADPLGRPFVWSETIVRPRGSRSRDHDGHCCL